MPNRPAEYPTLFDLYPLGTEPPVAQRPITPGCLLPAAPAEFIDVARAGRILGTGRTSVTTLLHTGHIQGYQLHKKHPWNILYSSVVEFCDSLRLQYSIPDRRPKLPAGRRWRDSDLLPFPLADTITVSEAMVGLELGRDLLLHLIEEGRFDAYRLYDTNPWRISKLSLFGYAARLKRQLDAPASSRRSR